MCAHVCTCLCTCMVCTCTLRPGSEVGCLPLLVSTLFFLLNFMCLYLAECVPHVWVLAGGICSPGAGGTSGHEPSGQTKVLCNSGKRSCPSATTPALPRYCLRLGFSLSLELSDLRLAGWSSRDPQASVCLPLLSAGVPATQHRTGFSRGPWDLIRILGPVWQAPLLQTLLLLF